MSLQYPKHFPVVEPTELNTYYGSTYTIEETIARFPSTKAAELLVTHYDRTLSLNTLNKYRHHYTTALRDSLPEVDFDTSANIIKLVMNYDRTTRVRDCSSLAGPMAVNLAREDYSANGNLMYRLLDDPNLSVRRIMRGLLLRSA
jgi:hypothetical protein